MSQQRVQVHVLGPLRVVDPGGAEVTPSGLLQRRLLSLLVLHRGRRVSVDAAVEALWPVDPPSDPSGALQNHLSRVRKVLPPGAVSMTGGTYTLDPAWVEVDSDRLAGLLAAASAADLVAEDLEEVEQMLDRWQGPSYADLADLDDARNEAVRLAELKIRARELMAQTWLADGAEAEAVAELTALIDEDPLRERPRALLVDALEKAGRRAEALRVYDDFRRLLGSELGIEPSVSFNEKQARLLTGGDLSPDPGWRSRRLPLPAQPLIGRDDLLHEATALVGSCRLLTLVGPGGVGKTRLLVELGHHLAAAGPGRPVVMCELAAADPSSVVNVVASALGIDVRPGVPLAEQVAGVLDDDDLVLLADNCEHVVEAVARLVHQLLERCPNLVVVASSRERLRVPGEQVLQVPPLALGHDAPAAQLFMARAQAAVPGFSPSPEDEAAISEIVRRLDGLPLAIELAAARLFSLDVHEVLAGLDHRFTILTAGNRASPRHETLAAAVWWSYEMLEQPLRDVLTAVSLFVRPLSAGDAAAVTGLSESAASEALVALVERSLMHRSPNRRFAMLETLRAFGAERLEEEGRFEHVAGLHALRTVERVEQAANAMTEPGRSAIDEIDASLPDLHAALGWLVSRHDVEMAGRLVGVFLDYGVLRMRPDVFGWADRVHRIDPDDRSVHAPRMWVSSCYAAWLTGDLAEAERCAARAMAVAERNGGPIPAEVHTIRANLAMFAGDLVEAQRCYAVAVEAAGDDPPRRLLATSTELLALGYGDHPETSVRAERLLGEIGSVRSPLAAYLWYCAGEAVLARDVDLARVRYERALEIGRETGASFVVGVAGASRTSIDARSGDPEQAARDYRDLIDHWQRAGMWSTQWTMLRSIAVLLCRLDRPHAAAVLVGAVRSTQSGHRIFGADEVALAELEAELGSRLGEESLAEALASGAVLDGTAAVEHALRNL